MSECKFCGTDRADTDWVSGVRCNKCDKVVKGKNNFKKLSYDNPADHIKLQDKFSWSRLKTEEEFNELKDLYLNAFDSKISTYKSIESHLREDVRASDIEHFLRFHISSLFKDKRREFLERKFSRYAGKFRERRLPYLMPYFVHALRIARDIVINKKLMLEIMKLVQVFSLPIEAVIVWILLHDSI